MVLNSNSRENDSTHKKKYFSSNPCLPYPFYQILFKKCSIMTCKQWTFCCQKQCDSCNLRFCPTCVEYFDAFNHYKCPQCIRQYSIRYTFILCKLCNRKICPICCSKTADRQSLNDECIQCMGCKYYWCNDCANINSHNKSNNINCTMNNDRAKKLNNDVFEQCSVSGMYNGSKWRCNSHYCQECIDKGKVIQCHCCLAKLCDSCDEQSWEFGWRACYQCQRLVCGSCTGNLKRDADGNKICSKCLRFNFKNIATLL